MKACCSGCSVDPCARPSIVVTCAPSFITASVRHEFTLRPSTRTVQAPHWPWSQPFLLPVRSRWSRSASSSVVQGASVSVRSAPFTRSLMVILPEAGDSLARAAEDWAMRSLQRSLRHDSEERQAWVYVPFPPFTGQPCSRQYKGGTPEFSCGGAPDCG